MNRIESRIATTERAKLRVLRDQIAKDIEARERKERALRRAQDAEFAAEWRYFVKGVTRR
jgi:hypothetical protein